MSRLSLMRRALQLNGDFARKRLLGAVLRRSAVISRAFSAVERAGLIRSRYDAWIDEFGSIGEQDRALIRAHIAGAALPELKVVLTGTGWTSEAVQIALTSLDRQLFKPRTVDFFLTAEEFDSGIAAAGRDVSANTEFGAYRQSSPEALAAIQRCAGQTILLIDGPVKLVEHALYLFAVAAAGGARVVYADSDVVLNGRRAAPKFKPQASMTLQRTTGYVGPCTLFCPLDAPALQEIAGALSGSRAVRGALGGMLDRIPANEVIRIPFVVASEVVVGRRLSSVGSNASSMPERTDWPTVTIIIPTHDRSELLEQCLRSVLAITDYPRDAIEIIVVDHGSVEPRTAELLRRWTEEGSVKVLRDDGPFNFSRLNNRAAQMSAAEILVFLNNDIVIESPSWLRLLVGTATQPDVGVVGGRLIYPDRTVQHAGIVLGIPGGARHVDRGEPSSRSDRSGSVTREVSAVTAACAAVRRAVFDEIGGFNEKCAVTYNDIALCLDACRLGYRNICRGEVLAVHLEAKTRKADVTAVARAELEAAFREYREIFLDDPYYNPNLSLVRCYDLALVPRASRPWRSFARSRTKSLAVLILSAIDDPAAVVGTRVREQCAALTNAGHRVIVGGPRRFDDDALPASQTVVLVDAYEAAHFAVRSGVDCVIVHTHPYFEAFAVAGAACKGVVCDYGPLSTSMFEDQATFLEATHQFCLAAIAADATIDVRRRAEADGIVAAIEKLVRETSRG